MTEPYELETLLVVRTNNLAEAHARLDERAREQERAATARQQAELSLGGHDRDTARVREDEATRDMLGRAASEARTAARYLERRADERRTLANALTHARERETLAIQATEAAREAILVAKRELEVVEKHHARWRLERAARAENRAQAELDDRGTRKPS
jgi:hypothetical protein